MRSLTMPHLALGTDEVIARGWLISPGDPFSIGQPLLEVETDKATMEVEAPFAGTLASVLCEYGDTVLVGAVIAYVAEHGEEPDAVAAAAAELEAAARGRDETTLRGSTTSVREAPQDQHLVGGNTGDERGGVVFFTVDNGELAGLPASTHTRASRSAGARGVVRDATTPGVQLLDDVEAAGPAQRRPLSRRRLAIARRMTVAAGVPSFATAREVLATPAMVVVAAARETGRHLTLTDALIWACAAAAHAHPATNAWLSDDVLIEFEHVAVALAVDTPDGVIAPVLREAEALGLLALAERRAVLVREAREGTVDLRQLAGATISLSNVGSLGAREITPVLTVPHVAVLGVGATRPTGANASLTVTFVGDHRAIDGAEGARFLATFADAFENIPAV